MFYKNQIILIGALTSKPYAFMARSWELKKYESIDIFDNLGSNVNFYVNNFKILRVLPKINFFLNEEWITDKVRFCYDGLRKQRLSLPLIRINNKLVPNSWTNCFKLIENNLNKKYYMEAFSGDLVDLETMYLFKIFLNNLGFFSYKINNYLNLVNVNLRQNFLSTFNKFQINFLNNLFLVGLNLRLENPLINLQVREATIFNKLRIYNFGFFFNLTYGVLNFGNNILSLINFLNGKSSFCRLFFFNKLTKFLIGYNIFYRLDYSFFIQSFKNICNIFKNFKVSFFFQGCNTFSSLELGNNYNILESNLKIKNKILYILNNDDILFNKEFYNFIIFQGHHGSLNVYLADLIFPGVIPYEKKGTYFNLYGVSQQSTFILIPENTIKNDWKILKALSDFLSLSIYYVKRLDIIRKLELLLPVFWFISQYKLTYLNNYNKSLFLYNVPLLNFFGNYYLTNTITRSSLIMSLCALRFKIINFF